MTTNKMEKVLDPVVLKFFWRDVDNTEISKFNSGARGLKSRRRGVSGVCVSVLAGVVVQQLATSSNPVSLKPHREVIFEQRLEGVYFCDFSNEYLQIDFLNKKISVETKIGILRKACVSITTYLIEFGFKIRSFLSFILKTP